MKINIKFNLLVFLVSLIISACNNPSNSNKNAEMKDTMSAKNAVTSQTFDLDTTKLKSGDIFYQCSMDPEVISDRPGSCPKCEMDLSEIKKM